MSKRKQTALSNVVAVVFDFHETISLSPKETNALKNEMRTNFPDIVRNDYAQLLAAANYPVERLIPHFDALDIVDRFQYVCVASSIESEDYIYELLRYCYEKREKPNPFERRLIISSQTLAREQVFAPGKKAHLIILKTMLNLEFTDFLLIDNEQSNLNSVSSLGVKTFLSPVTFRGIPDAQYCVECKLIFY